MKFSHVTPGHLLIACLAGMSFPSTSFGEDCFASAHGKCITGSELLGQMFFGPPENPLFALSNTTPETIIAPKPGQKLSASLLPQVIDALGQETTSVGLTVNPGLYRLGETISGSDLFRNERPTKDAILTRFSFSLSATEATDDDPLSKYGVGLSYVFDGKSPINNLLEYQICTQSSESIKVFFEEAAQWDDDLDRLIRKSGVTDLAKITDAVNKIEAEATKKEGVLAKETVSKSLKDAGANPNLVDSVTDEIIESAKTHLFFKGKYLGTSADKAAKDCIARYTRWNRPLLSLGTAGYLSVEENGEVTNGYGFWGSYAVPFPTSASRLGQMTISGKYLKNHIRKAIDGSDGTESVDGWSIGARYTHQLSAASKQEKEDTNVTRAFVELGYTEEEFGEADDDFFQVGLGGEVQLAEEFFVQVIVGRGIESDFDRSGYLSTQFNWSLSHKSAK